VVGQIRAKRLCAECHEITDQVSISCSYDSPKTPSIPPTLVKRIKWLCEWCGSFEEELKETIVPTERTKLVKRLLSLQDDYEVLGFSLSAEPDVISIKLRVPDFDMGELRAVQWKQQETGFITAEELMKVQRAGYQRPILVPAKPEPRDVATLRKQERQRAFAGYRKPAWE
jgi:hypothetical protein